MELTALRKMVAATIVLLLVYQVGTWIAAFFGGYSGAAAALAVAVASLVGVRFAGMGARGVTSFVVPSLAFAAVPLAAKVWSALDDPQATWVDHVIAITPLLVGFVVPIFLLLLVYIGLQKRALGN